MTVQGPSGTPVIFQIVADAVACGNFYRATNGTIFLTSIPAGSSYSMPTSGDCACTPAAGHNFLLQSGVGLQTGGGPWVALSDERIKTVEGDYPAGLDAILALRPVVYTYNGNDSLAEGESSMHADAAETGKQFIGLVAQEAEIPMPEMVEKREGFIDGVAVTDLRTLDTGPLIFALVNAIKELKAEIEALKR